MLTVFFLILFCVSSSQLIKCSPLFQGRSSDYSTNLYKDSLKNDIESEDEGIEIIKITSHTASPFENTKYHSRDPDSQPTTELAEVQTDQNITPGIEIHIVSTENVPDANYGTEVPVNLQINMNNSEHTATELPLKMSSKSVVESNLDTRNHSGQVFGSRYNQYSDFEDEQTNDYDADGSMNDEDNDFLQNDDDVNSLPAALKNLPRDIPPDRTIYEILAENIVKDKQYDELRIEELIHELMDHYDTHNGLGEVYADDTDYDYKVKGRSASKGFISYLKQDTMTTSTASA